MTIAEAISTLRCIQGIHDPYGTRLCLWALCRKPLVKRKRRYCSPKCGELFYANHCWNSARFEAHRRARSICERCKMRASIEINHIRPLNGRERSVSCENHQENLEALCHECHCIETAKQRRK